MQKKIIAQPNIPTLLEKRLWSKHTTLLFLPLNLQTFGGVRKKKKKNIIEMNSEMENEREKEKKKIGGENLLLANI